MAEDLDRARYVSFVSNRRDGAQVATPVWVVPCRGGYAFTTGGGSYKVRRVRNDPSVTITPCGWRGRVEPGATTYSGTAEVLTGDDHREVERLVRRKYWLAWPILLGPVYLLDRLRGRRDDDVSILVRIDT